jgi:flagellar hook-basal body complex protein FliE
MSSAIASIAAIAATQAGSPALGATALNGAPHTVPDTFASFLGRELRELNATLGATESAMADLAAGKPVELHDVMISLERARMSVQVFVQVRNKLVESYQDLMRMQL